MNVNNTTITNNAIGNSNGSNKRIKPTNNPHEKINRCSSGIFDWLSKNQYEVMIGLGVLCLPVGIGLVIGFGELSLAAIAICLISYGIFGLASELDAKKTREEYESKLKPKIEEIASLLRETEKTGKIDEMRESVVKYEEAKDAYTTLISKIKELDAACKACRSSELRKIMISDRKSKTLEKRLQSLSEEIEKSDRDDKELKNKYIAILEIYLPIRSAQFCGVTASLND